MSVPTVEGAMWYVSTTAAVVSERLAKAAVEGDVSVDDLAYDVAWLARQVGRLADMMAES